MTDGHDGAGSIVSVTEVLGSLRAKATSARDLGDRFERLVQAAFRTDRTYRERFTDVWLWMEWPDRRDEPDAGIDLVARTVDGKYVAIQAKCYLPDHTLVKEDIDSFFTASGRDSFSERIIVATTDRWSINAVRALERQQIPVVRLGIDDFDAMSIDWSQFDADQVAHLIEKERQQLFSHQVTAVEKVRAGFGETDRGQMIMACGTGKTFTSLRIAEEHTGPGSVVLFLAPSIALVSQSFKEWTAECDVPIRPYAVCSDATAGKPLEGENATPYDLPIPPTTDVASLMEAGAAESDPSTMTVIFSTYQSIQVIADLQTATGLVFDLVVCDEAHRTAGTSDLDEEASHFVKVHDNTVIPARKRLYMTATPRIYRPAAKIDARDNDLLVASMDDPETFGPEFYRLGFGEAVERGLLVDYRVLILTVEEDAISQPFQELLSHNGELNLPEVAKFIGCLSGLAKLPSKSGRGGFTSSEPPMSRAVAFWSTIADSQRFAELFDIVADHYNQTKLVANVETFQPLSVPTRHVDGTVNMVKRREDLRWLKAPPPPGECRVLSNARCLTEGVDVPALDAIMFLKPRRSKIDIVQAVGRVMRNSPGKHLGYIILPIAIPAGQDPADALNKNEDYSVVWDVLQALRSHDERFNAYINRIALSTDRPDADRDGPIQVIDANPDKPDNEQDSAEAEATTEAVQGRLFTHEDWVEAIYTKIVEKVGTRTYWEDWADDVVHIAERHQRRINSILNADPDVAGTFDTFLAGLHQILNDSITHDDAIAMLSQHLITAPIFDALFGSDVFEAHNPVAQAMQTMANTLEAHHLDTETQSLVEFYRSVQRRVEGIPLADGRARQQIIKDLYGRFFNKAFPKVADSLGIVYTPVEVVDFIIRATEAALHTHFDGASLTDPGVHVLDPFTGTGTFVTRLLHSGYIKPEDLERKYTEEIHANEFLLLAYYIAAVNIETTYNQLAAVDASDSRYAAFPGIVLTDTFQLGETGEGTGALDVFPINNARADRQRGLDLRVILGNPPYSAGQGSANDNNPNRGYPNLDASIADTYAARSTATLKNSLYDSYIRAIRWASNRLLTSEHGGIVAYVTNGGYIDSNTADGLRLTLADEFHHIYVYNLRGNQRTSGDRSRREGGKIFGSGSRATVAIMLLVKEPGPVPLGGAEVRYRDIGDYLTREDKLQKLDTELRHEEHARPALLGRQWTPIAPNAHGDWINQRSDTFADHVAIHADDELSIFELRTNGLKSNRDAWNYNSSRTRLEVNVRRMIDNFNAQVEAFDDAHPDLAGRVAERAELARAWVDLDPQKFSWDHADFTRLVQGQQYTYDDALVMRAAYRPFHRRYTNAGRLLNNRTYQLPRVYPDASAENMSLGVAGKRETATFATLMTAEISDLVATEGFSATTYFPQYTYEATVTTSRSQTALPLSGAEDGGDRRHNVTDEALTLYRTLDPNVGKDDIFFYVYGVLHSPHYRRAFADNLRRSLPRVPTPRDQATLQAFCRAGRELAELHTSFEQVPAWPHLDVRVTRGLNQTDEDLYRVKKMRYARASDPAAGNRKIEDRTTIIYNEHITIGDIPERAHDYRLGSRSGIDWVIETSRVRTDSRSGITNDPNDWGLEDGNPRYLFDLVRSVITVSMRTLDIVDQLPDLDL